MIITSFLLQTTKIVIFLDNCLSFNVVGWRVGSGKFLLINIASANSSFVLCHFRRLCNHCFYACSTSHTKASLGVPLSLWKTVLPLLRHVASFCTKLPDWSRLKHLFLVLDLCHTLHVHHAFCLLPPFTTVEYHRKSSLDHLWWHPCKNLRKQSTSFIQYKSSEYSVLFLKLITQKGLSLHEKNQKLHRRSRQCNKCMPSPCFSFLTILQLGRIEQVQNIFTKQHSVQTHQRVKIVATTPRMSQFGIIYLCVIPDRCFSIPFFYTGVSNKWIIITINSQLFLSALISFIIICYFMFKKPWKKADFN